ncbi:hypothetical protein K438DRAFT_1986778 [Mycena galopus ATCC 62051]|nr:hypothetical protein K438DRAFT_1986778 [Mycena galopus ATCC 62051]
MRATGLSSSGLWRTIRPVTAQCLLPFPGVYRTRSRYRDLASSLTPTSCVFTSLSFACTPPARAPTPSMSLILRTPTHWLEMSLSLSLWVPTADSSLIRSASPISSASLRGPHLQLSVMTKRWHLREYAKFLSLGDSGRATCV